MYEMDICPVSWSQNKSCLRKWPKTFDHQNLINKTQSTKIKILIPPVLGNIIVHFEAKYLKDWIKSEGAYVIWKKVNRRTTLTDGSASDKLCHVSNEAKNYTCSTKLLLERVKPSHKIFIFTKHLISRRIFFTPAGSVKKWPKWAPVILNSIGNQIAWEFWNLRWLYWMLKHMAWTAWISHPSGR